ncbi:MAG: helix-turn-helix domain-containing protein [Clostridiales bacterium]|nr:helix-turn-helix domain-containing protein [Clostridiales bacterium]
MKETFGSRLKQLRLKNNLKQQQLATLLDVNKRAISAYENDDRQPCFDILIRIAEIFHVSTDYLLGCDSNTKIDVSGLNAVEIGLVSELVENMSAKNRRLKKCESARDVEGWK